jgi:hypothetical protein
MVAKIATGEIVDSKPLEGKEYAQKGGLKGGPARSAKLSPKRRSEIAKKAAKTRWNKRK